MKNIEYDSSRPAMRMEKGDKAVIHVTHFSFANSKDKEKYKGVPNGKYEAICTDFLRFECPEYPILSGKYCFWHGNKWGCTDGIYVEEPCHENSP